ncbi:MAG: aminotransferase class IV [Pyrinomonadaceae bacterium]
MSEDQVYGALLKLIETNKVETGRARITLMPSNLSSSGPWVLEAAQAQSAAPLHDLHRRRAVPPEEGLALTVSPFRVNTHSPLAGLKSVNYLEHVLAWEEAKARNFDDAVTLNERGEIVSTTMANIFWLSGGTLHTPAASSGCLEGTTRGCVIRIAAELSIPVIEGVYDLSRLGDADEIFLTSSGVGVALVTAFDYHRYAIQVGSFSLRIREAFRQLTLESGKR